MRFKIAGGCARRTTHSQRTVDCWLTTYSQQSDRFAHLILLVARQTVDEYHNIRCAHVIVILMIPFFFRARKKKGTITLNLMWANISVLLNQYICVRARLKIRTDGRLAQREPQGYAGLTKYILYRQNAQRAALGATLATHNRVMHLVTCWDVRLLSTIYVSLRSLTDDIRLPFSLLAGS